MNIQCSLKDVMMFILSVLILTAFAMVTYFIITGKLDEKTNPQMLLLIGTAFGAWAANFGSVVNWWFGSSKGSADKDKAMEVKDTTIANLTAPPPGTVQQTTTTQQTTTAAKTISEPPTEPPTKGATL